MQLPKRIRTLYLSSVLDIVEGHEVYSFLDGFSGYHQLKITEENRHLTAFVTNWGAFVWMVMPFGLKNAPSSYQRTLKKLSKSISMIS